MSRAVVAGLVIVAHVYTLKLFGALGVWPVAVTAEVKSEPALVVAQLLTERAERYVEPASEVSLTKVSVEANALTSVEFDIHDEDLTGIIGPASAPRPSPHQLMDTRPFARCAGLHQGRSATVLLIVEIRSNGKLGTVEVARSGGGAVIDAEAIRFARSLRWIPGTRNQEAQIMRIGFPVTLVGEGSAELPGSTAQCVSSRDAHNSGAYIAPVRLISVSAANARGG